MEVLYLSDVPGRMADLLTIEEAERLLAALVAKGLDRYRNIRRAERWIAASLRPSKTRATVYGLKHKVDNAYQRIGSACYLTEATFAECLRRQGYRVRGDYTYAKEISP